MPPELTFQAIPTLRTPSGPPCGTVDLAGEARPRCEVQIPRAACPGMYLADCACGSHFATTVAGDDGDPKLVYVACRERAPRRQPAPGSTLFSPRPGR